jgi:hypothetical protein
MLVTRHDALVQLLASPDPHEMPARRSRLTQPGHPERHWWWSGQPQVYAAIQQVERDNAASYDEHQIGAMLVQCSGCRRSYYMTQPQTVCIVCRRLN